MATEIARAFKLADGNPKARVLLLGGEGKHFCTGADLRWMKAARRLKKSENVRDAESLARMYEAILNCGVPVIARIQGKVCGGGVGLVAASDIAASVTGTTFSFPETSIGLVPGVISPIVSRKIGASRFLECSLTGRQISASEARELGLIHFAGSTRARDRFISQAIARILSARPAAIREAKASILADSRITGSRLRELASLTAKMRSPGR
jgi:methylglutaconyl-CoA hydratase